MPATLADHLFHLPSSRMRSVKKHFLGESGGSVAPLHPNAGIHPGTYQCPYDTPSFRSTNPLYLTTSWWQGFYLFCPHNAALADYDNWRDSKNIIPFLINDTINTEWQQLTFLPYTKLSYSWGTTLHTLYFTTVYKYTPFLGQCRSWHLTNLFYHISRINYHFCLAKNHFIAGKDTHISNILLGLCTFPGDSPMHWHHSLILAYMSENSQCLHVTLLTILLFLANQGKPLHLSFYLHAWQNTKDHFTIADIPKHACR